MPVNNADSRPNFVGKVLQGDNLAILETLNSESIHLIYIDPPFNTHKRQDRTRITGGKFDGDRSNASFHKSEGFADAFDNYLDFLGPRLVEAHRILTKNGALYLHVDYREAHYCKVFLDKIFGRENFVNEIIWAYDYGAKSKKKWPAKHDNILFYAKNSNDYVFNSENIDREPYMAPGLVSSEKAARGKLPTDVWWHTIVGTNSHEKTGYPTQKPLGVIKRIITASSNPGDIVFDFFAGSGTTGEAAAQLGRKFLLIDDNSVAIDTMKTRFDALDLDVSYA